MLNQSRPDLGIPNRINLTSSRSSPRGLEEIQIGLMVPALTSASYYFKSERVQGPVCFAPMTDIAPHECQVGWSEFEDMR